MPLAKPASSIGFLEGWGQLPQPVLYVPFCQGDYLDKSRGLAPSQLTSMTWGSGLWGAEPVFGTASGVYYPPQTATSEISLVALINTTGLTGAARTIIGKRGTAICWSFRIGTSNNLEFLATGTVTSSLAIANDTPYAVGMTLSGPSTSPTFYRLDSTGLSTHTPAGTSSIDTGQSVQPNMIGCTDSAGTPIACFNGRISAAGWWSQSLSRSQMSMVLADLWNGAFSPVRPRRRLSALVPSFASAPVVRTRSATLAGAGALSATGRAIRTRGASAAGAGALSGTGLAIRTRSAAVAGVGALTATGTKLAAGIRTGAATLAGLGSLAASGVAFLKVRAATLAGVGSLSATGANVSTTLSLEERLGATLKASTSLSAIVGASIFETERLEGTSLPAVVYRISRKPIEDLDGPTGLTEATIELEALSAKRSTVRAIASLLRTLAYSLEASTSPVVQAVSIDESAGEADEFDDGSGRLVRYEIVTARAWVRE